MLPLRLVGLVPLGVGVLVLGFAWTESMLPLFGRLFASLVAIFFILHGLTWVTMVGKVRGGTRGMAENLKELAQAAREIRDELEPTASSTPPVEPGQQNYQCPQCGATLGENADVSPSGDVKCGYCNRWFNIHRG